MHVRLCPPIFSRLFLTVSMALMAVCLVLPCTGCEGPYTLHVEFHVGLAVSTDTSQGGATFTFTLTNQGESAVTAGGERFEFVVRDTAGAEVRRLPGAPDLASLDPGESVSQDWDQRDAAGGMAPPGDYTVSVRYRAGNDLRERSAVFSIR